MNYNEAYNFIFNEIGDDFFELYSIIKEDDVEKGINFIINKTNCSMTDAKILWVDLKCELDIPKGKSATNNQSTANVPRCPMCGSTNIQKISNLNRTASIVGFGILSKKIGKQWQCNNPNCKHLW